MSPGIILNFSSVDIVELFSELNYFMSLVLMSLSLRVNTKYSDALTRIVFLHDLQIASANVTRT